VHRQADDLLSEAARRRAQGDRAGALALLEPLFDPAGREGAAPASAWALQADLLAEAGQAAEAARGLERATHLWPDDAGLWNRLGMMHHALGRYTEALAASDQVLRLKPQAAVAWLNRARTLEALQRLTEALSCVEHALQIDTASAASWCQRGMLLGQLQRHDDAMVAFERALALQPALAQVWAQRAGPLRVWRRYDEALASCRRALELDAGSSVGWEQQAYCLVAVNRFAEARQSLDRALQADPANDSARFSRGVLRLTLGDYEGGWPDYEVRAAARRAMAGSAAPPWRPGDDPAGRTLLLRAEQGLGDTLQFCRYAPLLARAGVRVVLEVPPVLHGLLQSLGDGVQVIAAGQALPPHDLQCPLLGVPMRLGTRLESIPAALPYLEAPQAAVRRWRDLLGPADPGMKRYGLAFRGNAAHSNDHNRSLTRDAVAALLQQVPGARWHLVQKDVTVEEANWLAGMAVVDHRAQLTDFCDTAALALCLDAVVSVDTSVAHLAGALGVPLHVLLPASPEWRWLLDRSDSPWYPGARLYRQSRPGDWSAAVAQLAGDLGGYAGSDGRQQGLRHAEGMRSANVLPM